MAIRIGFGDQMLNLTWKMKEQPEQSVELRVADPPPGLGDEGVLGRLLAGAGSAKEGLVLSQDSSCLRRQEGAAGPVCDAQQGNDLFDAGASALDADAVGGDRAVYHLVEQRDGAGQVLLEGFGAFGAQEVVGVLCAG